MLQSTPRGLDMLTASDSFSITSPQNAARTTERACHGEERVGVRPARRGCWRCTASRMRSVRYSKYLTSDYEVISNAASPHVYAPHMRVTCVCVRLSCAGVSRARVHMRARARPPYPTSEMPLFRILRGQISILQLGRGEWGRGVDYALSQPAL